MKKEIDVKELEERIDLNYERFLNDPYYFAQTVYEDVTVWAGDVVGRALLAFVSHYKINGRKNPNMDEIIRLLPEKLNGNGYLGIIHTPRIHEQQLSGHSWFLRGLSEYYEQFGSELALQTLKGVVESLYLPLRGRFKEYPTQRDAKDAENALGEIVENSGGWILSSDVGCAFMSVDGLSHAYKITKDERIKELLDEMIDTYVRIDKIALNAQTHCTLTSARGMINMYRLTGDGRYLKGATSVYHDYVYKGGCTYTYHNINWWGKPHTFSEPCAIIDSLMLTTELYKITGEEEYRTFAARVYHNAFSQMQRSSGGAGTDELVCKGSPLDYTGIAKDSKGEAMHYEAYWCCSMRLAEGLWYVFENKELLYAQTQGTLIKNERGVYMDGDLIYCQIDEAFSSYAEDWKTADGYKLCPILKYWKIPKEDALKIKMKVVFHDK